MSSSAPNNNNSNNNRTLAMEQSLIVNGDIINNDNSHNDDDEHDDNDNCNGRRSPSIKQRLKNHSLRRRSMSHDEHNDSNDHNNNTTDNDSNTGRYPDPTDEELLRIEYLREQLLNNQLRLPQTMMIEELGGEQRTLLRFVRARTKSKELAWEMLRNTLKWREKWHTDQCLERTFLENESLYELICSQNAFYVGHGRQGHPIYIDYVANMPWKRILSEFTDIEVYLRTQIQTMEWQQQMVFKPASIRAGYPITQIINIWNLKGLTLNNFTGEIKNVTRMAMSLTQDNYPESLYQSYIINAPKIFTMIWSVIKFFLDQKTRNKVHIMGSGKSMFDHLSKKLGPDSKVTYEMVSSKFADIGIAKKRLGLESAHKISQDFVRAQLKKTNESLYVSESMLELQKEELHDDEYFDASDNPWWMKIADNTKQIIKETTNSTKSWFCCCNNKKSSSNILKVVDAFEEKEEENKESK